MGNVIAPGVDGHAERAAAGPGRCRLGGAEHRAPGVRRLRRRGDRHDPGDPVRQRGGRRARAAARRGRRPPRRSRCSSPSWSCTQAEAAGCTGGGHRQDPGRGVRRVPVRVALHHGDLDGRDPHRGRRGGVPAAADHAAVEAHPGAPARAETPRRRGRRRKPRRTPRLGSPRRGRRSSPETLDDRRRRSRGRRAPTAGRRRRPAARAGRAAPRPTPPSSRPRSSSSPRRADRPVGRVGRGQGRRRQGDDLPALAEQGGAGRATRSARLAEEVPVVADRRRRCATSWSRSLEQIRCKSPETHQRPDHAADAVAREPLARAVQALLRPGHPAPPGAGAPRSCEAGMRLRRAARRPRRRPRRDAGHRADALPEPDAGRERRDRPGGVRAVVDAVLVGHRAGRTC